MTASGSSIWVGVVVALPCVLGARPDESEGVLFFESRVRPLLVERCFRCHGGEDRSRGGLRLDGREAILEGGDSGPAVVPGEPERSLLVGAVSYARSDLQMPPRDRLPPEEIEAIVEWVRRGAPWPAEGAAAPSRPAAEFDIEGRKAAHWSWRALRSPAPPAVRAEALVRDPLDRFVLARLEEKGIRPAPEADRRTLVRRVSFDLAGLPPAPEEVEAFVADDDPAALESLVDRLLASPRFGETWGRHWLDLVRYAETRGHEFDFPIANAWEYRDWVIRSFNADVPHDRLVTEHIAGDLIPDPRRHPERGSDESILGTGFWYLGEWTHSPVETRTDEADRIANQIDVLGRAFLGLTVGCARCHDHKFDAISQRDYYALAGFAKGSSCRQVRFETMAIEAEVAREMRSLDPPPRPVAPAADPPGLDIVFDFGAGGWSQDGSAFSLVRPGDVRATPGGPRVFDRAGAFHDPAWEALEIAPGTELAPGRAAGMRPGRTIRTPTFTLTKSHLFYLVRGAGSAFAEVDGHRMVEGPLHGGTGISWEETGLHWRAHRLEEYRSDPERPLHRMHVELSPRGAELEVYLVVQGDAPPPAPPPAPVVPSSDLAADPNGERRAALAARLGRPSRTALAALDGGPTNEHLLIRGNPNAPAGEVPRRYLEALGGGAEGGRLDLARRMTDPRITPFVPRVAVNRIWHHLFGRGIVPTVDDFGAMGLPPSDPDLLDHLAARFVEDGWSWKRAIRTIVLSGAYRRSGRADPRALEVDPSNETVHHRPARRLPAEAVRDSMLAISGRLDPTLGGPPIPVCLDPFQDGRGKPASGPLDGAGRRSVYLAVRRNFLPSMLLDFDFPQPFSTMGRRGDSNVPAQSLILRNHPFVHDQAAAWGRRVAAGAGSSEEKITGMFLAAYARRPSAEEVAAARALLEDAGRLAGRDPSAPESWKELAHALFQAKELIFVD